MASASWNESSFRWRDISIPESVAIDVVCAKEDVFQVSHYLDIKCILRSILSTTLRFMCSFFFDCIIFKGARES